mgnify:CR=1 FL=1
MLAFSNDYYGMIFRATQSVELFCAYDGTKHRQNLQTTKSSKELERIVQEFKAKVESRQNIRKTDITFREYAKKWKEVYKHSKEGNTKAMYSNIIDKHFILLDGVKVSDIGRIHLQLLLNNANGKPRTQEQIYMAFKQVLGSAMRTKSIRRYYTRKSLQASKNLNIRRRINAL